MLVLLILCFYCTFSINGIEGTDGNNRFLEQASNYLLDGLNKSVNPCDNAFGFLCTKWLTSVQLQYSDDEYSFSDYQLYLSKNYLQNDLFRAVNSINPQKADLPKYKLWLRTYFDRCLAMPTLTDDLIMEQVFRGLQRNIGPAPFLVSQNKSLYDELIARNVWYVLGRVQRSAVGGMLFEVHVMNVQQKPTLVLNSVSVSSDRLNETMIKMYLEKFAGKLNIVGRSGEIEGKIRKIFDFETNLMNFVAAHRKDLIGEYLLFNSTQELMAFNPNISWDNFFRGLFSTDNQYESWDRSKAKFQIKKNDADFFTKLDEFLAQYDSETIFNYVFCVGMKTLHAEAVEFKSDLLSGQFLNETCLKSLTVVYNTALLKLYFDEIGENGAVWQRDVRKVVDNVMSTFGKQIDDADWLTGEEKAGVKKSLQTISYQPAIPDWFDSEAEIEKNTIKFDPTKGTFDNYINIKRRVLYLELERYIVGSLEQNDRLIFSDIGYYLNQKITFMLGSMLPPFYHRSYPDAIKYAVFGTKVAQALARAFSENNYAETIPENLWTKVLARYNKRRECLGAQVKTVDCPKVPEQCHDNEDWFDQNSISTLSEIDGLKLSYLAYQQASAGNQSASLGLKPDLSSYSKDQLFFMYAGRSTCYSFYFENSIEDGGKTKESGTRLSKVIRNVPNYGKVFKCDKNSSSHHDNACSLWVN